MQVAKLSSSPTCYPQGYDILANQPTTLLQKNVPFPWYPQAQEAFDKLKAAMCHTLVLALLDFSKQFSTETDACSTGVRVVLCEEDHPITFYMKALDITNQKLSIYEKDFLAIIMALGKWRTYLVRHPFIIKIDNKSLWHLED